MAADALIFDLDGTIWDSAVWFAAALCDGNQTNKDYLQAEFMQGANIVSLINKSNLTRKMFLRRAFEINGPPPLFEGMEQVLRDIKQRGTPLAIATSLPGTLALPMLKFVELDDTFLKIVHAGICRSPKPNPTSINVALRSIGVQASSNVFYIGDRLMDEAAALNAGITPVLIKHGYEAPYEDSCSLQLSAADLCML